MAGSIQQCKRRDEEDDDCLSLFIFPNHPKPRHDPALRSVPVLTMAARDGVVASVLVVGMQVVYRLYPPCLWFPDLDIPPRLCEAEGAFEEEAARMLNPKIKVYGRALLTRGDPYCETVFEEVD